MKCDKSANYQIIIAHSETNIVHNQQWTEDTMVKSQLD